MIRDLETTLASGARATLKYQVLTNKACLQRTLEGQHLDSDLVSGVYEGGLKIWECSLDLVHYIARNPDIVRGKRVLELGCGQGLPGICALIHGQASNVMFQDYNEEVLEKATTKTVSLNANATPDAEVLLSRCDFRYGSWESLALTLDKESFDVILMSETLYNTAYYDSLLSIINHCLTPEGLVVIGTKTLYFGLGGGLFEFQQHLLRGGNLFTLEVVEKLNDLKSIERMIIHMTRAKADAIKEE